MTESSQSIEELKNKIGAEWELGVYEIDRGMIRRFAQAIDDPNPLWQDEEYAKKSRYGGLIAPPTFTVTIGFEQIAQKMTSLMPGTRLHGSTELECYELVRPGDTITVSGKIADIRERQGKKLGTMVFMTLDITYKNQRQELVAKCRQMIISY